MHSQRICRVAMIIGLIMPALLLVVSVTFAQDAEPPAPIAPQSPMGSVFTYQGQLKKITRRITDNCLMAFRLYDQASGGSQIGSPITTTVPITNGLFTVALDFGSTPFAGEARWLGITVRCTADSAYIDLSRQALTAAPYSTYSLQPAHCARPPGCRRRAGQWTKSSNGMAAPGHPPTTRLARPAAATSAL